MNVEATARKRIRFANLFGLDLAYDKRGIYRPEYLAPGTKPIVPGPWRIYRMLRR